MTARTICPISVLDLFAGCGGLTQGFHDFQPEPGEPSPFRTVGAVEWDIAAASTYAANFADEAGGNDHIFAGDIKDWDPGVIDSSVDVILGGPPCQGFSGLGKEDPDDPRNKLWEEYVRVVLSLEPKIFVIENVDRFFRSREFELLKASTSDAGKLRAYKLEAKILNAADYGVPQARKRAIVLATHRDIVSKHPKREPMRHPRPTHRKPNKNSDAPMLLDVLKDWVPASVVFSTTSAETPTTELPDRYCQPLGTRLPGTFRTSELHIGRNPTARSLARYRAIPEGGNRKDLPAHLSTPNWIKHKNGSGDVMGRMYWDQPSVTIRTEFYKPEKGQYLHPQWDRDDPARSVDRPITHFEAARLQSFPDSFGWCGTKVEIARQIGNAVPPMLAEAIARHLESYLRGTAGEPAPLPCRLCAGGR